MKSPNNDVLVPRSANRSPSAGLKSEITKKSAASKRKDHYSQALNLSAELDASIIPFTISQ